MKKRRSSVLNCWPAMIHEKPCPLGTKTEHKLLGINSLTTAGVRISFQRCRGLFHADSLLTSEINSPGLRGPAVILFISRDACSDSIAKLCRACFHARGGYRTIIARYVAK